jgi:hypothetical protein
MRPGGAKVLGKSIKSPGDLAQLVRTGRPAASAAALTERLHLVNGALSRKPGIPSGISAMVSAPM